MEDLKVGDRLGCYELLRKLGEGGMGVVFAAVHKEIERRVAIKVLRPQIAQDQQALTRLFNEARAANLIGHPGVVQIHDCVHSTNQGTAYLVMEYLDGVTLGARLAESGGALAETAALRISHEIAALLSVAHRKGIIHRDLKPENIMLVPDPAAVGGERVKVLDFGIAKLLELGGARTGTNLIMGTPRYMSPEQCRSSAHVDDRSDVYSLGVMLFQMLSGALPFNSESYAELLYQHMMVPAPELRSVAPGVSQFTAELVMSLLGKAKDLRPAMPEVAAALAKASHSLNGSANEKPVLAKSRGANKTMVLPAAEVSTPAPGLAMTSTPTPSGVQTLMRKRWFQSLLLSATTAVLGLSLRAGLGLAAGPLAPTASRPVALLASQPVLMSAPREPLGAAVELLHSAPASLQVSSATRYSTLSAKSLVDGDLETAWNSRAGDLVGASVQFTVPDYARVHTLQLTVGFPKVSEKGDLFTMNHRISAVTLFRNGALVGAFKLDPEKRGLQQIEVNQPGGHFELQVDEVIPGTRRSWREVCISEFLVWGFLPAAHPPAKQEPSVEIAGS